MAFQVGHLGLESGSLSDRRFAVMDEKRHFVSGRKFPRMVLIEARVVSAAGKEGYNNRRFSIKGPGMPELEVDLPDIELAERETFQVRQKS